MFKLPSRNCTCRVETAKQKHSTKWHDIWWSLLGKKVGINIEINCGMRENDLHGWMEVVNVRTELIFNHLLD